MSSSGSEVRYTKDHEWVRLEGDIATIGISNHAQEALGDVVFVQLPEVGTSVAAGDAVGEVESTKSVSELYAPIAGTVSGRNDALEATPELVNSDPYGAGWLIDLQLDAATLAEALEGLLDADAYGATLDE